MTKIFFLESVAGIAGDMFVAAFVDAGLVEVRELHALVAALDVRGVEIKVTKVVKATMAATHVAVVVEKDRTTDAPGQPPVPHLHLREHHAPGWGVTPAGHGDEHHHAHYADVDSLIRRSALEPAVRERARQIFRLIAEAEAAAHGMPVDDVMFHEVGTLDSIVDVVMAAFCIERMRDARICATAIRPGRGFVRMAHGTHPIPPPASMRLLEGLPVAAVPAAITRQNVELSTPTGIAILKALQPEFVATPAAGIVCRSGLGAGTMDLGAFPNVFRLVVLEAAEPRPELPYESDEVVEIVCNVDDDTSEHLAWMAERLLAQGALDVWQTAATGKKGRPFHVLSLLANPPDWERLADWVLRNGTTFGIRHRTWQRLKLARRFERKGPSGITHKLGLTTQGELLKTKPEFEEQRREWERREQARFGFAETS